jgi:REP element-mobilizing transposase RayT
MKFDPQKYHRRSIRLQGYDYSQAGAYYVTVVTQLRECSFGEIINGEMQSNDAGKMIRAVWESMPQRFPTIELGAFIVMPNHFHGIVVVHENVGAGLVPAHDDTPSTQDVPNWATTRVAPTNNSRPTMGEIIGAFKSITTHEYVKGEDELGWPQFYKRLWQRNYYEHIIRDADEWNRIHLYIASNPSAWDADEENPVNAR